LTVSVRQVTKEVVTSCLRGRCDGGGGISTPCSARRPWSPRCRVGIAVTTA